MNSLNEAALALKALYLNTVKDSLYSDMPESSKNERKRRRQGHWVSVRTDPKIGRNDKCPCGSGKKYKLCCLNRQEVEE